MSSQAAQALNHSANLIEMFSRAQLALVKRQTIRESTLLELLTCAFFVGAEQRLRKQSGSLEAQSLENLNHVIMGVCKMGQLKASALVGSVHQLAEKYHLVQHIIEQGEQSAEHWLNCDTESGAAPNLTQIIDKYHGQTLYELGIEGVNKKYLATQDKLFNSTNKAVQQLRIRAMGFLLFFAGVAVAAYAFFYFKPFGLF